MTERPLDAAEAPRPTSLLQGLSRRGQAYPHYLSLRPEAKGSETRGSLAPGPGAASALSRRRAGTQRGMRTVSKGAVLFLPFPARLPWG